jgi:hypothetical protein
MKSTTIATKGGVGEPRAADPVVVDVWVRCVPGCETERTNATLARLAELKRTGVVDDVRVHTWANAIDRGAPAGGHDPAAEYARFEAWATARRRGLLVSPPRTAGRGRMGPEYVTQSSPWVLVAVYRSGDLVDVAPTVDSLGVRSIPDLLDGLDASGRSFGLGVDDPLDAFGVDRPHRRRDDARRSRRWVPNARRRTSHRRYSAPVS